MKISAILFELFRILLYYLTCLGLKKKMLLYCFVTFKLGHSKYGLASDITY